MKKVQWNSYTWVGRMRWRYTTKTHGGLDRVKLSGLCWGHEHGRQIVQQLEAETQLHFQSLLDRHPVNEGCQ